MYVGACVDVLVEVYVGSSFGVRIGMVDGMYVGREDRIYVGPREGL